MHSNGADSSRLGEDAPTAAQDDARARRAAARRTSSMPRRRPQQRAQARVKAGHRPRPPQKPLSSTALGVQGGTIQGVRRRDVQAVITTIGVGIKRLRAGRRRRSYERQARAMEFFAGYLVEQSL